MNDNELVRFDASLGRELPAWGWEIPVYLFLGGLAAGVMIATALLAARADPISRRLRLASFAAPLFVSVGMGALFLDLAHRAHVLRFYLAFRWTSPMSWGAWILVLVYPVTLFFSLSLLDAADAEWLATRLDRVRLGRLVRWARRVARAHAGPWRRASLGVGVALGIYTGILLSTLAARPLWGSALLGPLFLTSGMSTGIAFLLLVARGDVERHVLERWHGSAIIVEVGLLALFLLGLATSDAAGREAAALLLGGRFTAQFWTLVVIGGLLVPLALEVASRRLRLRPVVVAPVLVLVGGLALRWILVAAGQA